MTRGISRSHPRYESLRIRELLVSGYRAGIVATSGLIAHGRGEAFDYLMGEKTIEPAAEATRAAAAAMILAKTPVISVNGNSASLVPSELVRLSELCSAPLEVSLFHPSAKRKRLIKELLERVGAKRILGVGDYRSVEISDIASARREVDILGINDADVVLVPLEDGDRTEALVKHGKKVIAIDLNPLSRTARYASITIVDNISRALPNLIGSAEKIKKMKRDEISRILSRFNNTDNLRLCTKSIQERLIRIADGDSDYFEEDLSGVGAGR